MTDYLILLLIFTFLVCASSAFLLYCFGKTMFLKAKKKSDEHLPKIMHWAEIVFIFSWSVFLIISAPYIGIWDIIL